MGPWYHGGWNHAEGDKPGPSGVRQRQLRVLSKRDIKLQFFNEHLKGSSGPKLAKAIVFETGDNRWRTFDRWPPATVTTARASTSATGSDSSTRSRPRRVTTPSRAIRGNRSRSLEALTTTMSARVHDLRSAFRLWHRPDVLSLYVTEPLPTPVTLAGPVQAHLTVSTTATDADWIVKLIDVYPDPIPSGHGGSDMAGKQILIRSEVVRGRYRTRRYDKAVPFVLERASRSSPCRCKMSCTRSGPGIGYWCRSLALGSRSSTAIRRRFVPNIFLAREADFESATHHVFRGPGRESWLELETLPDQPAAQRCERADEWGDERA